MFGRKKRELERAAVDRSLEKLHVELYRLKCEDERLHGWISNLEAQLVELRVMLSKVELKMVVVPDKIPPLEKTNAQMFDEVYHTKVSEEQEEETAKMLKEYREGHPLKDVFPLEVGEHDHHGNRAEYHPWV